MTPKHSEKRRKKIQTNAISHMRRPQIIKIRKQSIVGIEYIKNDIFKHFKTQKLLQNHPKTKI